jgi:iron complex transport system permease protein
LYGPLFLIAPVAFIFVSLFVGRYPLSISQVLEIFWLKAAGIGTSSMPETYTTILWDIRLPRAVLGAMVGASLATSGAAFQGLFRNPLVSSSILGVSTGASFGAALAILLMADYSTIFVFSFAFGLLAVCLTYLIGTVYKTTPTIMLVLGGVIVSAIFSALLSLVKFVADPYNQLPTIVFWLMGSLASARFQDLMFAGIPMVAGLLGLAAVRWRVNVLSLGDEEARTLGVRVTLHKGLVILLATMATAGAVCVTGVIGWVGLVIPHIGRMLVGNDNRALIPVSMSLGACFMILIDCLARTVTGAELPLGILTSLVGAPFFVFLLKKTKGRGW